jgi:outer membrane phospholipase A
MMALGSLPAHATEWLIATDSGEVSHEGTLEMEVVRQDANGPWPDQLPFRVAGQGQEMVLTLHARQDAENPLRRTYACRLPPGMEGLLRGRLDRMDSNQILLMVAAREEPAAASDMPQQNRTATIRLDPIPDDEPALSANEPMYFVLGARTGLDARFQLSFKYRLFDEASYPVRTIPALGKLYFAYTQTSLWDLAADSKPFRDTSFRPSLFWQGPLEAASRHPWSPDYLRAGLEHESNGKDGLNSRSMNTLFLQPVWRSDFANGRTLLFFPKVYAYLDRKDNPDIADYRGYADWNLRYGNENGWVASAQLRHGSAGKNSGQIDLSWPLREPLFARTGGFLHLQLFSGYGETLLDYNRRQETTLRVGFSIVR